MKRICIGILFLVVVAVAFSAIQNLQLSTRLHRGERERLRKNYLSQQPVNLEFEVVDQFDEPARNYSFSVTLRSVRWFYRVYPFWARTETQCNVRTDQLGRAHLKWDFEKSYEMKFSEVIVNGRNLQCYEFPAGKDELSAKSFEDDPLSTFPVPQSSGEKQQVHMMVTRNTPPRRSLPFKPPLLNGGSLIRFPALDEQFVTISLKHNILELSKTSGDILITITNAKSSGQTYWARRYHKTPPLQDVTSWEIRLEGLDATEMLPVGTSPVSDPPDEGYQKSIIFRFCPDSTGSSTASRLNPQPKEICGGIPVYCFFGDGLDEHFFVKTENPRYYCWLTLTIVVDDRGTIALEPTGFCNLEGKREL